MEYQNDDDNEEFDAHIPTIVTNSPTSLSTTDLLVAVPVTESEPEKGIITTTVSTTTESGIIGSTSRRNSISTSSDFNIDTITSATSDRHTTNDGSSIIVSDCPIRALGQVCICNGCETSRRQLLRQQQSQLMNDNKDLRHNHQVTEPLVISTTKRMHHHNVTAQASTAAVKRSRAAYKYSDDDDDDNDDIVDHSHSDTPIKSGTVAVMNRHNNGDDDDDDAITATTMAVTEVVTTSTAHSMVNNNNNDDDTESHKLRIMSQACRTILQCIGEDPDREGLQKTPERWAKALLFLCHGYHLSPSQVTNNAVFTENHNEMVVVRNIDIHSLCEHHMVPFTGHVHIGYIPNGKIIGLSKLARLADLYARRLQVQERLTRQIADAILETITPLGVAVVMECTHYCMVMRGVQKTGTITTTSSVRGCFETNSKTRAEFFSILHGGK